jgi:tetratricopeptide (TPR) repeat protein
MLRPARVPMFVLTAALVASLASADMPGMPGHVMSSAPPPLMSGLGPVHHTVTTRSPEAQKFFDQGLALCYGFNHDEAIRAFLHAADLDSSLMMAHWGVALALGPNINMPMDSTHEARAVDELARARGLVAGASALEREYLDALATRYGTPAGAARGARDTAYANAMRSLATRHPDDPDAGTLAAEAAMDLRPWHLWTADGRPEPGTEEIVAMLDQVLKGHPNHTGANHLMIHALEASPHPERAMTSANRLRTLAPGAGHLVHMPTHIDSRVGDWVTAGERNDLAAGVDRRYIADQKPDGVYPIMYFNHNLQFAAYAWTIAAAYAKAHPDAKEVTANGEAVVKDFPMAELVTNTTLVVETRFRHWDTIRAIPEPPQWMPATRGYWNWAQGTRLAMTGFPNEARVQLDSLRARASRLAPDYVIGLNPAPAVLAIAAAQLAGRIAETAKQPAEAIARWREAAALEDSLGYDEPPDWYAFSRESLGGVLLRSGDAAGAVQVFRDELERHPNSPRALFGLARALDVSGKTSEARTTEEAFEKAARAADVKLSIQEL